MDYYLRERIGFSKNSNDFPKAKKAFLKELESASSFSAIFRVYYKHRNIYRSIETHMPKKPMRVGIVGELYTLMEPFSNHFLEKQLARSGIAVSRKMSASFLLFGKWDKLSLWKSKKYMKYTVGANGVDSVTQSIHYAKAGYDGLLHIKSFGCTPELNAQPILVQISRDYDIPILHLSFDTQTSETGLQTRMEAFTDMLKMKKEQIPVENRKIRSEGISS